MCKRLASGSGDLGREGRVPPPVQSPENMGPRGVLINPDLEKLLIGIPKSKKLFIFGSNVQLEGSWIGNDISPKNGNYWYATIFKTKSEKLTEKVQVRTWGRGLRQGWCPGGGGGMQKSGLPKPDNSASSSGPDSF